MQCVAAACFQFALGTEYFFCGGAGFLLARLNVLPEFTRFACSRLKKTVLLRALFNNAGMITFKPALEYTQGDWDRNIGVNLTAYFLVAQAVGRVMVSQGSGAILNTASKRHSARRSGWSSWEQATMPVPWCAWPMNLAGL